MATINNKLIHFKSKSDFNSRYRETTDGGNTYGDFLGTSIVFIQDAKQIWTHGQFYDANETTLASLGVTATATELNYIDGVTSNVQTQLNGKAALSHTHTASQVSGLADVATSGSYNDLSDKPEIPDVSELATKSELSSYLPLSGGKMTGGIDLSNATAVNPATSDAVLVLEGKKIDLGGGFTIGDYGGTFKYRDYVVLTEANYSEYISFTDTKNTTGTSNSTSRLYLAGGTSQSSTGVVTYSNVDVYTKNGQLYATQMNAINGFYETSDARLKNFKDDIKALDVVSKIPTKYFTWKKDETDDSKLHIGTSAQEIQKLYPDLVTENEEGELSVDYARLSVIALAAIKELKKEIDTLKSASVKYKF